MKHDRFQNHIAESIFTLPVCAALATFLWWWPSRIFNIELLAGWIACGLITYLLVEINNKNQVIRLRTRLMSSAWLVAMGSMAFLHPFGKGWICALLLVVCYFLLFQCYQERDCIGNVFHCFLLFGIGSLFYLPFALFAVAFFWYLAVFLRSMDRHILRAGIIGLLLPYWLWFCWSFWQQDFEAIQNHLQWHFAWSPQSLIETATQLSLSQQVSWILISVLVVLGALHFLQTKYNDKIRVRMILYIFACQVLIIELALLFLPYDFNVLLPLLMLSGCPFVAHYFALTGNWFSNILFCLAILSFAALTTMQFWIPLMNINFN